MKTSLLVLPLLTFLMIIMPFLIRNGRISTWGNLIVRSCSASVPNLVSFTAKSSKSNIRGLYTRIQFEFRIAHASTTHKFQGQTQQDAAILYPPKPSMLKPTLRGCYDEPWCNMLRKYLFTFTFIGRTF